jgi:membrane-associated protease RseP (regulator of RpoE activity)
VDTSLAASVMIAEQFAESRHLFAAHLKTIKASDPRIHNGENIVIGRPKEIQIGAHTIEGAIAAFSPSPAGPSGSEIAGVIGGGILRRFTVVFDLAQQQLILSPNLRMHELEEEDKSGLSIVAKGPGLKQFEIAAVLQGTPAANAGLKTGDVIAGIDEDPAVDLTLVQVRELFRQQDHKYKLTVERGGQSLQISLQTRRLL